jgi:hypothetical protein
MQTIRLPSPAKARKNAGLTLQAAANLANCAVSTVHRAEKARKWPKQSRVRNALAKALGVDLG